MEKKNNKKGFTLVELVIVVAVMAVLVAVAIPTISSVKQNAQDSVDKSNAQTIESMIKLAEAENDGATLDEGKIKTALEAAKLGITSGTYIYDSANGTCKVCAATDNPSGNKQFKITYATTGSTTTITVAQGS